jgi:predicted nucleic acid-binding protein
MIERVFIDTNILVYAFLENDTVRHDASVKLLSDTTSATFSPMGSS